MKSFIIGDIHGCCRPLLRLLDILSPDPKEDRLILLGDLFDRGPDSWDVWQEVQLLAQSFGDRFVLLRGNHEDYLLSPKLSFAERRVWERVGRGATVRSFTEHGSRMEECIPWVRDHVQLYYRDEREGFQCVHAGLKIDPPEANDLYTLVHDHSIVLTNRYAGPLTITGHIALDRAAWFAGDEETVEFLPPNLPEEAENRWQPLPAYGTICIDTGCGKGGSLTGMVIEDGKYVLVNQRTVP